MRAVFRWSHQRHCFQSQHAVLSLHLLPGCNGERWLRVPTTMSHSLLSDLKQKSIFTSLTHLMWLFFTAALKGVSPLTSSQLKACTFSKPIKVPSSNWSQSTVSNKAFVDIPSALCDLLSVIAWRLHQEDISFHRMIPHPPNIDWPFVAVSNSGLSHQYLGSHL